MKTVRIGVVGLGSRGRHWLRVLRRVPGCRVTAVCDRYEARTEAAAAELGGDVAVFHDYRRMLRDAAIDAVGIVTEPLAQAEIACAALEGGRHVVTEVPLSYDLDHCWDVVLAVERSGLVFQMAEQTRYWGFIDAWRRLVADGALGEIVMAQGEYIAPYGEVGGYFLDTATGEYVPASKAAGRPGVVPSERYPRHPIAYSVHELSPLLSILGDRIDVVTCLSSPTPSLTFPETGRPDFELALMRTTRGAVIREAVGFTNPMAPAAPHHWYQLVGTKGAVETPRAGWDHYRMWLKDAQMSDYARMPWGYELLDAPAAARGSGHGDADYYPFATFVDAIKSGTPAPVDVYTAVEASAPGIVAALSAERNGVAYRMPDFRPNAERPIGREPATRRPEPMPDGAETDRVD